MAKLFSCSFFGCLGLIVIIVGGVIYIVKSVKSDAGICGILGCPSFSTSDISADDRTKLEEKVSVLENNLAEDKEGSITLSEKELGILGNDFIQNAKIDNFAAFRAVNVDCEPDQMTVLAKSILGSVISIDISVLNIEDGVDVKIDSASIGKFSLPDSFKNNLNLGVDQLMEQMKTNTFGSVKISNAKIMKDYLVIEIVKV